MDVLLSCALPVVPYTMMLVFTRFVLGCKPRSPLLVGLSYLMLLPQIAVYWYYLTSPDSGNAESFAYLVYMLSSVLTTIGMFVFVKIIFPKSRLLHLIFACKYVDTFIALSTGVVLFFVGFDSGAVVDVIGLLMMVGFTGLFLSPLRFKLREIITGLPKVILIVSLVLVMLTVLLDNYNFPITLPDWNAMNEAYMPNPSEAESKLMDWAVMGMVSYFVFIIMELTFYVALTFYLWYSASYTRMKVINASYEQQIQIQAEHYKNLADANAEVRRFRHDFKNTRFAIEKLLAEGKGQEALELMRSFGEAMDAPRRQMVLFDTGNGIADALLTDKLRRAAAVNTVLTFSGSVPSRTLQPTDLCVLLGNTLDNAIEACQKLPPEAVRAISVECNCNSGFLFLTIRNPVAEQISVVDNRVATTKKDKALHGFGIQSMHTVAKKYDGSVKLNAEGGCFTVEIDLCLMGATA